MQSHPTPSAHVCTTDLPPGALPAGIVLDASGKPTHRLVLLPQRPDKRLNWADAKAWAASVGGDLPSPEEQALLFANCRDALPKTWCWSSKEHEQDASYAWDCDFYDGDQTGSLKSYGGSAVAVRRLPLESLNPSTEAEEQTDTALPAEVTKAIQNLRKRLSRWELDHLRKLSSELADRLDAAQQRIEDLESELARAWHAAESWRDDAHRLVEDLHAAGKDVGLTKDGALMVMADEVPF